MDPLLLQSVIPFLLSALIVIIITVIAEKYGTKVGGILGTLPSTLVVAFIFIAINKGVDFASQSVAVVPAELGVNMIFLFVFILFVHRSTHLAFAASSTIWAFLSLLLFIFEIDDILISITIFVVSLLFTFTFFEYIKKIPSIGSVNVHYTPMKIVFRVVLAGIVISISVLLSNLGAILSGIFSVFPAIISSTMLITIREHGPDFAAGIAKSMIFGVSSVFSYATAIHFFYPLYGIAWGSFYAYCISIVVTLILYNLRGKIR
jgi:uncharacterized membrane protein (GlpM family)